MAWRVLAGVSMITCLGAAVAEAARQSGVARL